MSGALVITGTYKSYVEGAGTVQTVTGFLWWRHRDDDDDDAGRRRRRVKSAAKSKLPRPVAVARPVPTEA